MTSTVMSAFAAGREADAAALVFEYMAATQAETGRPVPAAIGNLPAVLQRECRDLHDVYRAPGVFLIADHGGRPAACVGLAVLASERTAEVKRLYVRPASRGNGIARTLMSHAHHHAAWNGITRLILDVLPARTAVISFYHRLGYTETGPYETESPVRMIYMERFIKSADLLPKEIRGRVRQQYRWPARTPSGGFSAGQPG
jgi:GNAT superfamily N-acetyltransferase